MPKVVIQAGHQNTQNNIDVALHGSTGAPGEVAFTVDVANQVSAELRKRKFEVIQTDANFNSDPKVGQDYDLFLAIHYEADVHNTNGYFIAVPAPDADAVNAESKRIRDVMNAEYSKIGIPQHNEWENPNTKYYYMWRYLSAKTPCVLIECGVGWRVPKDSDILNSDKRTTVLVPAIVKGICKAFNIPYDTTPPVSSDPCEAVKKDLKAAQDQLVTANTKISQLTTSLGQEQDKSKKLQNKIDSAKAALN